MAPGYREVYKKIKKIKKIDKEKDTKTNKNNKWKEYIIGTTIVEILDGITIKVSNKITNIKELEERI